MVQDASEADGSFTSASAAMRPAEPLLVLKFGSSVLRSVADLPRVAGEIYRQRRRGFAVVAVVSALEGETDRLFAEAATVADGAACAGVADLVSLGEARTAALLRIACDRIGLAAENCQPEALGLATVGGETGSRPLALDPAALRARLARTGLVIVPGFVGIGAEGQRTLLERGGSDFSAIYLGGELGAAAVRLYKDADGVFEADPARDPSARRFDEISWDDALQVARPLIQPQAVEYAAARRLPIEIEAIGSERVSRVGPRTSAPHPDVAAPPVRVALAGYGVVGQALARRLKQEPRFEIVSVLVRDTGKSRAVASPVPVTDDLAEIAASAADILVDALSCERLGAALCGGNLKQGAHVASASKRVVSEAGSALAACARNGAALAFSAAVGGGVPMLETIARVRADGGSVVRAWGILNGTVNAILTGMARGHGFAAALARAQAAGFAEADPSADLSGADAAAKLRIIARAAFPGAAEPAIAVEALDEAAAARVAASGGRWVQVAELSHEGGAVVGRVQLAPLASLGVTDIPEDEWNCLHLELADGRRLSCTGRGAGGAATAEAIVADLYDLAALPRSSESGAAGAAGRGRVLSIRSEPAETEVEFEDFAVALPPRLARFGASVRATLTGRGNGPAVVVIGGISGTRFVCRGADGGAGWWPGMVGAACAVDPAERAVLAFDFAADDSGAEAPTTKDQADVVIAALDAAGIGRAAIVGASYGGMVALSLAAAHPERAERLVVISADASPHPTATAMRELQRRTVALGMAQGCGEEALAIARGWAMLSYRTPEEFGERFAGGLAGADPCGTSAPGAYLRACGDKFVRRMSPGRFLSLSGSIDRHRVDPAEVRVPVLLIGATSDQLIPPARMRDLADRLGGPSELRMRASRYGHDMFLKDAGEIGTLVAPFLDAAA